jgi:hypothetical protein
MYCCFLWSETKKETLCLMALDYFPFFMIILSMFSFLAVERTFHFFLWSPLHWCYANFLICWVQAGLSLN